jgi:hypothetical protein
MGTTSGEGRDILQDSCSAFLHFEGVEGVDGMVDGMKGMGRVGSGGPGGQMMN